MVFKKKQPKTEGVVVGGSKHKFSLPDIKKLKDIDWRSKLTRKNIIIVGIIIVIVPLLLYAYGEYIGKKDTYMPVKITSVCGSDKKLIEEVIRVNDEKGTKNIKAVTDKIKSLSEYSNDPNCIYALVLLDLKSGDVNSAKSNYRRLQEINQTSLLNEKLIKYPRSVSQTQDRLNYYQKAYDQAIKNAEQYKFKTSEKQ